jgi:hypothetical protein
MQEPCKNKIRAVRSNEKTQKTTLLCQRKNVCNYLDFRQLRKARRKIFFLLDKLFGKPYIIRAFDLAFLSDSRKAETSIGMFRGEAFLSRAERNGSLN